MGAPLLFDEHIERAPSRVLRTIVLAATLLVGGVVAALALSSVTAAPAGALIRGIDVASWQHPGTGNSCGQAIDWGAVRNSGVEFAYVKSTQENWYTNPCFAQDWVGIANAGMLRGSYHYAKPQLPISTAVDQARYFVSRAGSMTGPMDLPGMLDLEETGGLNATDLSNWTRAFLNEVTVLTGKKPVIYMGAYFFPGTIAADIPANYRLWIPSYPCQSSSGAAICNPYQYTGQPRLPTGWSTWTFWQFSSIEPVPGIVGNVDMNWFCCDIGSLRSLAGGGGGAGSPFGYVDSVTYTPSMTARITGWAIDPDSRDPIDVHVYVDSVGYATTANGSRNDLAAVYPGFGAAHGYSLEVPLRDGAQRICAFAINTGSGGNLLLGCRDLGGNPFGSVDVLAPAGANRIALSGWALDPNSSGSIGVHVYVDGAGTALTADQTRNDIASVFPGYGAAHGFSATIAASTGAHNVCVFGINVGPGSNVALACRIVTVEGQSPRPPFGSLDVVSGVGGGAVASGWAIDPDTTGTVSMLYVVDGQWYLGSANATRNDIGAAFPSYGSSHGFSQRFDLSPGAHTVCVAALDAVGGTNHTFLGCRSVVVTGGDPFGSVDVLTTVGGRVVSSGWAIDPDTNDPIQVHVYVNGVGTPIVADGSRPDVGAAFGRGSAHGFSVDVPRVGSGSQSVCVFAINVGSGGNQALSCRTLP